MKIKTSGEPPAGPRGSQPGGILLFWVVSGPQRARWAQLFGFLFGRSFRRNHAKTLIFYSKERRRVCPAFWKKNSVDGREPPGLEAGLPRHPSEGTSGIAYRRCMDKFDTKCVVFFPSGPFVLNTGILNGRYHLVKYFTHVESGWEGVGLWNHNLRLSNLSTANPPD